VEEGEDGRRKGRKRGEKGVRQRIKKNSAPSRPLSNPFPDAHLELDLV
jgi:hypothetical protein